MAQRGWLLSKWVGGTVISTTRYCFCRYEKYKLPGHGSFPSDFKGKPGRPVMCDRIRVPISRVMYAVNVKFSCNEDPKMLEMPEIWNTGRRKLQETNGASPRQRPCVLQTRP
jgi:hypothetical protein